MIETMRDSCKTLELILNQHRNMVFGLPARFMPHENILRLETQIYELTIYTLLTGYPYTQMIVVRKRDVPR
jgi:hypothetical protein